MTQPKSEPSHDKNAPVTNSDIDPLPELNTYLVTDDSDRIAALRLIADSVAQQRQVAAKEMIFHPFWLSAMVAALGIVYKLLYKESSDLGLVATTWAGCLMAGLLAVRGLTGGYLEEAEKVGTWTWLGGDEMIITKFGERIIGVVVVGVKGTDKGRDKQKAGVIRAWTVLQRYRRKGVGTALLQEAVEFCRGKGVNGLVVFDEKHANSRRVLPRTFNGGFDRREKWARECLEVVVRRG